ncbi:MAG: glycosyltransferase family protein [Acidimicrobiales bacterium]
MREASRLRHCPEVHGGGHRPGCPQGHRGRRDHHLGPPVSRRSGDRAAVAVIQARMGSTRLPGKVLRPLGHRPVLQWVVDAAMASDVMSDIVVATTTLAEDDAVAELAESLGVRVHRGPVDDVLERFLGAIADVEAGAVVRLTGDCPLLDPSLIRGVVELWRAVGGDYVSTVNPRSLPRGLDVELIAIEQLRRLDALAQGVDRVHVTSYVNAHPDEFRRTAVTVSPGAEDLRITLDTPEDAELLDAIVSRLGSGASNWRAVVDLVRSDQQLLAINAHIRQKAIAEG